ncbi:MAG: DUF302 domain-containing protein [Thiobacillaceae bacterium]
MKIRVALLLSLLSVSAVAADVSPAQGNPYLQNNPYLQGAPSTGVTPWMGYSQPAPPPPRPWTMSPPISKADKARMIKMMMPWLSQGMHMNIRDVMNFMSVKYKAKPGLSFDDVVESLKIRANTDNFKLVGQSPMWKDIAAVLGDTTSPRMEVFHFCDIAAGRELMKLAPEAIVFLPCRIAVMEDADKNIWVLTLDWDLAWLDSVNGTLGISPELAKMAVDIRDRLDDIMRAGANGDL